MRPTVCAVLLCVTSGCLGLSPMMRPSKCADTLLSHGTKYIPNAVPRARQEMAAGACGDGKPDWQVATVMQLKDDGYVNNVDEAMSATNGMTPEQVQCAKAEHDVASPKPGPLRVPFAVSPKCRMASSQPVAPGAAESGVVAVFKKHPKLTIFAKLVELEPGFVTLLSQAGPYTVFAPSDEAFAKTSYKDVMESSEKRLKLLQQLAMNGNLPLDLMAKHREKSLKDKRHSPDVRIETIGGKRWTAHYEGTAIFMHTARATEELPASNGSVYVINEVPWR